jgi:2-polyprenyl-3-methyl-5-hydroxy-6-metoxy-1,4-benzoquinol methylase
VTEAATGVAGRAERYQALLEHVPCAQCGASDVSVVYPPRYERARDDVGAAYRSSGDDILIDRLVRCRQCGLMYLDPRVRQDVVLAGYAAGEDETFISQAAQREATFAPYVPIIERLLGRKGRVLDVGTAGGSFLAVAKRRGWDVIGCEPSRWLCEWGTRHYGIDIRPGTVFDLALPDGSVDVVSLWDVLEHVPDPLAVLRECRRVVKEDGLIVVNVPDSDSWIARAMGRRWVFLLSVHLYYFTLASLTRMLRTSGFEVVRHSAHWQRLEVGYVFQRMEAYIPVLPRVARAVVRALRIEHLSVPYWLGQTNVMARARPARPK